MFSCKVGFFAFILWLIGSGEILPKLLIPHILPHNAYKAVFLLKIRIFLTIPNVWRCAGLVHKYNCMRRLYLIKWADRTYTWHSPGLQGAGGGWDVWRAFFLCLTLVHFRNLHLPPQGPASPSPSPLPQAEMLTWDYGSLATLDQFFADKLCLLNDASVIIIMLA